MQLIKENLLRRCKKNFEPVKETELMNKYLLKRIIIEGDVKSAVERERRYFIQYYMFFL